VYPMLPVSLDCFVYPMLPVSLDCFVYPMLPVSLDCFNIGYTKQSRDTGNIEYTKQSTEKRKTPPVVQGFKSASRIHEITVLTRTTNIWEYASPGLVRWSKIF
jgi:hypothetical protein